MKKIGIVLFSTAILLTGCAANNSSNKTDSSSQASSSQTAVNQKELDKATADYKSFVQGQIDQLLTDTEKFRDTLKEGKLDESFGESDVKIDFRLVDYVDENKTEEGWSGFHRIEKIMWEENTTKGTESYADQLVNDIKELKAKIATVEVTPDMMLTGAVDLLNEVATSKITGEEEVFSHTDLYDFRANIEGAEKIFELFKPLIQDKDEKLVKTLELEFKNVNGLLDKHMTDSENYKLYTELTKEDTKELAEAVTKLGEPLSQMGVILDGK